MAFADSSTNNFQLTAFGNAQISTSVKKYGDGSLFLPGNSSPGSYVGGNQSEALQFGTQDFTIEMWINAASDHTFSDESRVIYTFCNWPSTLGFVVVYHNGPVGGGPGILITTGGFNSVLKYFTGSLLNKWTHIALCRNNGNILFFVDGVLQTPDYSTPTQLWNVNFNEGLQYIGRPTDQDGVKFHGYIDDLRITKGIARYTSNFTPPPQQLPAPSDPYQDNVSLLLHMDGLSGSQSFIDNSTNNFTLSAFGNAQISTSVKKLGSGSGYFDGNGDRIATISNPAFAFGTGDFTVEFWINPNAAGSQQFARIIQCGDYPNGWQLVRGTSGGDNGTSNPIQLMLDFVGGSPRFEGGILQNNIWSHVAVTRQSGTVRIFVNGTLATSAIGTTNLLQYPLVIGSSSNGSEAINAYIDDLRITKGVARYTSNFVPHTAPFVNPPQIPSGYLAFWKLADLTDSSPNGNNLVNTNNVQFVSGKIGNCAQFDGANYLSTSNTFLLNQVTFSCWFKNTGSPSLGIGTGYPNRFRIVSIGGDVYFQTPDAVTANTTGASLNDGNWHFCVGTSNGTTSKLYIDGALVDTSSVSYSPPAAHQFSIGGYGDSQASNGTQLDAVGLWNRELTQSEIDILYNNGNGREP